MIGSHLDRGARCQSHHWMQYLPHCRTCHSLNREYLDLQIHAVKTAHTDKEN